VNVVVVARWPIRPILGFWWSKFHKKIGDSLLWTPMNRRAKFDATSFILGGEIRNRTKNKATNSKRYIHTLPIDMCITIAAAKPCLKCDLFYS